MTMMTIPPPRRKYRHYRHWDQRAAVMGMAEMVPVWEKANLTLEEAAAYFGIGINKLRDLTNEESCPFVLWNGSKRLIKRYLTTGGSSIELQRGVGSVIKYRAGAVLHCGIQHLIDVTIPPFQQHLYS